VRAFALDISERLPSFFFCCGASEDVVVQLIRTATGARYQVLRFFQNEWAVHQKERLLRNGGEVTLGT